MESVYHDPCMGLPVQAVALPAQMTYSVMSKPPSR